MMKGIENWMIEAWILGQMDVAEIYVKFRKTSQTTIKFSAFADEFMEEVLNYGKEIVQKGGPVA